jgi:hypothetical protein
MHAGDMFEIRWKAGKGRRLSGERRKMRQIVIGKMNRQAVDAAEDAAEEDFGGEGCG